MLFIYNDTATTEIYTKHINTLCGQNVDLLNVKLAVHIVTTRPYMVNFLCEVRTGFNPSYIYSPPPPPLPARAAQ
jgi:hypothetical protein